MHKNIRIDKKKMSNLINIFDNVTRIKMNDTDNLSPKKEIYIKYTRIKSIDL